MVELGAVFDGYNLGIFLFTDRVQAEQFVQKLLMYKADLGLIEISYLKNEQDDT